MTKRRPGIPKRVKDSVLAEFNHRCAMCGSERPQLHHLDQNPANNDPANLLPLCPNHHLTDQHDASNQMPHGKLRFFRAYKHRLILKPQFNALFRRMQFLDAISDNQSVASLHRCGQELAEFIGALELGGFYSAAIRKLLELPPGRGPAVIPGDPESEEANRAARRKYDERYRMQLRTAAVAVQRLVIEMLDYQQG